MVIMTAMNGRPAVPSCSRWGAINGLPASAAQEEEEFSPRASALNVIVSRQNLFLPEHRGGAHAHHGVLPWEGLYSVDDPTHAGDLVSPHHSTPQLGAESLDHTPRQRAHSSCQGTILEQPLIAGETGHTAPSEGLEEYHALTVSEAVFNLLNTVVGVGVLSLPYAFRLSGYSSLLLVLVIIGVTSTTGRYIGEALVLAGRSTLFEAVPRRGRDYTYLAHVAFGRRTRLFISVITSLEIWFALVTFVVMNAVNVGLVMPGFGGKNTAVVTCCLAAMCVFLPMRVSAYLSLVSSVALAVASLAMVGAALQMPSWAYPYEQMGVPALLQLWNMPRSVGIIIFCFAGHPCFPIVHECMKDRDSWRKSVSWTFVLAFLYYGGLGTFGYLVFGENLEASFTQNLAEIDGALFWRNISACAFIVKIQLTAPLLLNAILVSIWAPEANKPEWPLGRICALITLTGATAMTGVAFAKDVAVVASLTGSLFVMTTSVLFPSAAHFQLQRLYGNKELTWRELATFAALLCFGVSMLLWGTALALHDLLGRM